MRVISGSAKGAKLVAPDGLDVRPTLDRVKESVFNILAFSIQDKTVLDLFSGSGALGIEALSRGAKKGFFVDKSQESLLFTKQNLEKTSLSDKGKCILSDFAHFLQNTEETFDIIFLDPPYADGLLGQAIKKIYERNLLRDGGYIVCETDIAENFLPDESLFKVYRNKRYGKAHITVLTNE